MFSSDSWPRTTPLHNQSMGERFVVAEGTQSRLKFKWNCKWNSDKTTPTGEYGSVAFNQLSSEGKLGARSGSLCTQALNVWYGRIKDLHYHNQYYQRHYYWDCYESQTDRLKPIIDYALRVLADQDALSQINPQSIIIGQRQQVGVSNKWVITSSRWWYLAYYGRWLYHPSIHLLHTMAPIRLNSANADSYALGDWSP